VTPFVLPKTSVHLIARGQLEALLGQLHSNPPAVHCNLEKARNETEARHALAKALAIDPAMASNWDAFADSLGEQIGRTPQTLVVSGIENLAANSLEATLKVVHQLALLAEEEPKFIVYFVT
jgi:Barstar (barnase inhibitor)